MDTIKAKDGAPISGNNWDSERPVVFIDCRALTPREFEDHMFYLAFLNGRVAWDVHFARTGAMPPARFHQEPVWHEHSLVSQAR